VAAAIKAVADARVGDTITLAAKTTHAALPGYTEAKPMDRMFPIDADQFEDLQDALEKLKLNDASLV